MMRRLFVRSIALATASLVSLASLTLAGDGLAQQASGSGATAQAASPGAAGQGARAAHSLNTSVGRRLTRSTAVSRASSSSMRCSATRRAR